MRNQDPKIGQHSIIGQDPKGVYKNPSRPHQHPPVMHHNSLVAITKVVHKNPTLAYNYPPILHTYPMVKMATTNKMEEVLTHCLGLN